MFATNSFLYHDNRLPYPVTKIWDLKAALRTKIQNLKITAYHLHFKNYIRGNCGEPSISSRIRHGWAMGHWSLTPRNRQPWRIVPDHRGVCDPVWEWFIVWLYDNFPEQMAPITLPHPVHHRRSPFRSWPSLPVTINKGVVGYSMLLEDRQGMAPSLMPSLI